MADIRTNTLRLVPSREEEALLRVLGERVSRLWNAANYLCRRAFLAGKPVPGYATLCARLVVEYETDYYALPSDIAQETLKKLAEAWKGFRALRKEWKAGKLKQKPGFPKYRKDRKRDTRPFDFIPIKSARTYDVAGTFRLTLPAELRTKGRLSMKYVGCERYRGERKRAEVMWDKARERWYVKSRHVLICRDCGCSIHSDQAGSRNILSFNHPGASWDAVKTTVKPDTRRWNTQRRVDASNRSASPAQRLAAYRPRNPRPSGPGGSQLQHVVEQPRERANRERHQIPLHRHFSRSSFGAHAMSITTRPGVPAATAS